MVLLQVTYRAADVAADTGALLPHRFTLAWSGRTPPSAVSLCCTRCQVAPTWLAPAPCPVKSRLSSTPGFPHAAATRPTHRPPVRLRLCGD